MELIHSRPLASLDPHRPRANLPGTEQQPPPPLFPRPEQERSASSSRAANRLDGDLQDHHHALLLLPTRGDAPLLEHKCFKAVFCSFVARAPHHQQVTAPLLRPPSYRSLSPDTLCLSVQAGSPRHRHGWLQSELASVTMDPCLAGSEVDPSIPAVSRDLPGRIPPPRCRSSPRAVDLLPQRPARLLCFIRAGRTTSARPSPVDRVPVRLERQQPSCLAPPQGPACAPRPAFTSSPTG